MNADERRYDPTPTTVECTENLALRSVRFASIRTPARAQAEPPHRLQPKPVRDCVSSRDHQLQELLHLGLEAEGFLFNVSHGFVYRSPGL